MGLRGNVMDEQIKPMMDGPGSPQDEMERQAAIDKREEAKLQAKLKAEFIKSERARKRNGLK